MGDTQLLEIVGRHRLIERLLAAGVEVAIPARDRGVDLIAYLDLDQQQGKFLAVPIQMKAAAGAIFAVNQKYWKFPELLIAYVWNANSLRECEIFVATQAEACRIADEMGYTKTASWQKGAYVVTRPSPRLIEKLDQFRVSDTEWLRRLKKTLL